MPRPLGSKNVAVPKLKYKVLLYDHLGNCTLNKSFSSVAQISKFLPYWSDKTIERVIKGTSKQPFLHITKI